MIHVSWVDPPLDYNDSLILLLMA